MLRGPNGEILYQNEMSLGSSGFEEFKTEDLKERKFFSLEESKITGDIAEFMRTEREITGGKTYFKKDPNTGEMIRVEGEEEHYLGGEYRAGYKLPNICSPREESKKLKIKMPLSLKQRM